MELSIEKRNILYIHNFTCLPFHAEPTDPLLRLLPLLPLLPLLRLLRLLRLRDRLGDFIGF